MSYDTSTYDPWDPQHWMLDGLVDFNYTFVFLSKVQEAPNHPSPSPLPPASELVKGRQTEGEEKREDNISSSTRADIKRSFASHGRGGRIARAYTHI